MENRYHEYQNASHALIENWQMIRVFCNRAIEDFGSEYEEETLGILNEGFENFDKNLSNWRAANRTIVRNWLEVDPVESISNLRDQVEAVIVESVRLKTNIPCYEEETVSGRWKWLSKDRDQLLIALNWMAADKKEAANTPHKEAFEDLDLVILEICDGRWLYRSDIAGEISDSEVAAERKKVGERVKFLTDKGLLKKKGYKVTKTEK